MKLVGPCRPLLAPSFRCLWVQKGATRGVCSSGLAASEDLNGFHSRAMQSCSQQTTSVSLKWPQSHLQIAFKLVLLLDKSCHSPPSAGLKLN